MINRVEDSYKHNIISLVFGPMIKLIEAVFDLLIPLFMKAIIDLNRYEDPSAIPNSISSALAKFIRLFGIWVPDNQNLSDALIGGAIILVMSILGFCITMVAQYVAARTAVNVGSELRTSLFEKILSLSKKDREKYGNARLQTTLNNDVYQVERGVLIFVRLIARAPFVVLGSIIFCFILDWRIGLAFACIVPLLLISLSFILRRSSKNYKNIQKDLDDISNKASDTIDGARVVRAFNAQQYENDKFDTSNEVYQKESLKVQKNNALINPIIFEITSLVTVIIFFFMLPSLFNSDDSYKVVLTSTLIAAMAYLAQIFFATVQLSTVLLDLTKARVSRGRINEIYAIENSVISPTNPTQIVIKEDLLKFDNVCFTYDKNEQNNVLKDISFLIKKGETLGIIGGTGSGKSTIISLIERFMDPTKGDIYYGNANLKDVDLKELRSRVGLVNQKSSLFNGTIRHNFLMANPNATEEDMMAVLKEAEAYDFVYAQKENLDREIKEGGTNVSGGQRQRLCIARALIKKPELLILDDSTSALDLLTDKKIRNRLKQNKEMSKVIVSQRISSIMDSDYIIVIDKGCIVGKGRHDDLLKTCPIYEEIYRTQTNKE
ncbi:MAG: ABC transporter ATP-binding protein/permease [Bacilli bacterium]|nr:ABC transporter ATP-binding protein/permease [Bacilli bacterium]